MQVGGDLRVRAAAGEAEQDRLLPPGERVDGLRGPGRCVVGEAGQQARATSVVVALLYAVSVAATMIGETWLYYLLGSTVEIALLLTVAAVAWRRRG